MAPRRRKGQPKSVPPEEPVVWLRAEIEFGTTFSYRQPDASAQFAIGSPVPSPATIKLALVDTAIRWKGDVDYGRQVFEWLKTCPIYPVPPKRVVRFRVFLKRLKPPHHSAGAGDHTVESTGIRDYFLLEGPLTVFLYVPQSKSDEAKWLLRRLRKLGTSDSLCWCTEVSEGDPDEGWKKLFPRNLGEVSLEERQGWWVVRLSDLTDRSEFDHFNPYSDRSKKKVNS